MGESFPQTYWTVIQRAVAHGRSAFNRIAHDYREPVQAYLRASGFSPEDAEDLAQDVLLIVCDGEFLKQADARKGRFRTLLVLVAKNVMNDEWRRRYAKKRRGKHVPLDGSTVVQIMDTSGPPDEAFEREWWAWILKCALERLHAEQPERHRLLHLNKTLEKSQAEIAQELATTPMRVQNELRAAKARLREILSELVREYCSSPGEFEEEIARLREMLG